MATQNYTVTTTPTNLMTALSLDDGGNYVMQIIGNGFMYAEAASAPGVDSADAHPIDPSSLPNEFHRFSVDEDVPPYVWRTAEHIHVSIKVSEVG